MDEIHHEQIDFILRVVERYKKSKCGYLWRCGPNRAKVRVSLADFILVELGALKTDLERRSHD